MQKMRGCLRWRSQSPTLRYQLGPWLSKFSRWHVWTPPMLPSCCDDVSVWVIHNGKNNDETCVNENLVHFLVSALLSHTLRRHRTTHFGWKRSTLKILVSCFFFLFHLDRCCHIKFSLLFVWNFFVLIKRVVRKRIGRFAQCFVCLFFFEESIFDVCDDKAEMVRQTEPTCRILLPYFRNFEASRKLKYLDCHMSR